MESNQSKMLFYSRIAHAVLIRSQSNSRNLFPYSKASYQNYVNVLLSVKHDPRYPRYQQTFRCDPPISAPSSSTAARRRFCRVRSSTPSPAYGIQRSDSPHKIALNTIAPCFCRERLLLLPSGDSVGRTRNIPTIMLPKSVTYAGLVP
jgi:hypothetical protein